MTNPDRVAEAGRALEHVLSLIDGGPLVWPSADGEVGGADGPEGIMALARRYAAQRAVGAVIELGDHLAAVTARSTDGLVAAKALREALEKEAGRCR